MTNSGLSKTTHNSPYAELNSIFVNNFIMSFYKTTDDVTGFLSTFESNATSVAAGEGYHLEEIGDFYRT